MDARLRPRNPPIFVDALNLFQPKLRDDACAIKDALLRVTAFMRAALNSGHAVEVFIDASLGDPNGETDVKFRERREAGVRRGVRDVPQGSNVMVGDMFRVCGARVHYSLTSCNDDTLAAWAWRESALILSRDSDFLRYQHDGRSCFRGGERLFTSWLSTSARLQLVYTAPSNLTPKTPIVVIQDSALVETRPRFAFLPAGDLYFRGAPSGSVKEFGNIHGYSAVVRLRRAVAARCHMSQYRVEWPDWDGFDVVWPTGTEVADRNDELFIGVDHLRSLFAECLDEMMLRCEDIAHVQVSKVAAHVMSCAAVLYELWLWGQPQLEQYGLMMRMLGAEKWLLELVRSQADALSFLQRVRELPLLDTMAPTRGFISGRSVNTKAKTAVIEANGQFYPFDIRVAMCNLVGSTRVIPVEFITTLDKKEVAFVTDVPKK